MEHLHGRWVDTSWNESEHGQGGQQPLPDCLPHPAESRKLAQQYSQSEVISKVAGSDSVLGSIKKLAKTAFKFVF
jgi:hypothetical protein